MATLSEFSLIQHYFEQLTPPREDVLLGIGDDCALLQCPAGHVVAASIDTLVEGIHFFADVDPESLGHKSLAVGLSDLAAMGATPAWFTLAITLPEINERWLKGFAQGLAKLAKQHKIQLVGGGTTRGPLTISIQVHGFVRPEQALRRDGAQVGDLIYVTGTLGDAGAALQLKLQQLNESSLHDEDKHYLQQRLERPTPRVEIGLKLLGLASSVIDISDGLAQDLTHLCTSSKFGALVDLNKLPISPICKKLVNSQKIQLTKIFSKGDDYQILFTSHPKNRHKIKSLSLKLRTKISKIGIINRGKNIAFKFKNKKFKLASKKMGYIHNF